MDFAALLRKKTEGVQAQALAGEIVLVRVFNPFRLPPEKVGIHLPLSKGRSLVYNNNYKLLIIVWVVLKDVCLLQLRTANYFFNFLLSFKP